MSHTKIILIALAAVLLLIVSGVRADSLQLKNGNFVQGKYLGGTERAVQFAVNGKIHLYDIDEILSISFASASADGGIPSSATDRKSGPSLAPKSLAPRSSLIRDDLRGASSKRMEPARTGFFHAQQMAWEQKLCSSSDNPPAKLSLRRTLLCADPERNTRTTPSSGAIAAMPVIIPKSVVLTD